MAEVSIKDKHVKIDNDICSLLKKLGGIKENISFLLGKSGKANVFDYIKYIPFSSDAESVLKDNFNMDSNDNLFGIVFSDNGVGAKKSVKDHFTAISSNIKDKNMLKSIKFVIVADDKEVKANRVFYDSDDDNFCIVDDIFVVEYNQRVEDTYGILAEVVEVGKRIQIKTPSTTTAVTTNTYTSYKAKTWKDELKEHRGNFSLDKHVVDVV